MRKNTNTSAPRLPAEWEPQSAILITWPHDGHDWADMLDLVEAVFTQIAQAVSYRQNLLVVAKNEEHRRHLRQHLENAGVTPERLHIACLPSNDTWFRDYGPISVYVAGRRELLDFTFNAWGGKYPAQSDNRITRRLHRAGFFGEAPLRQVNFVMEGGAIESDGQGTLLAKRSCLVSPARNPDMDQNAIETLLAQQLGITHFLWLNHGYLEGDDTDGHIDTLARFCDPQTIIYMRCDDPGDSHYPELLAMEKELQAFRRSDGQAYHLFALPWPQAVYNRQGQRLPATYANFLIINQAVLVPVYDDPADTKAIALIQQCFPRHGIVPLNALPLLEQFGSVHCATMQIPL